ncbi:MAG TPA: hypothetical protein ENN54_01650 [Thermoplasmatales archaeon]|nr:hypothetical protein [Thermoplasmatales archaeon]
MSRYGSDLPEPPWVYSPGSVKSWLESTAPGARVRKSAGEREGEDYVKNVELLLDLDVEKTPVQPSSALLAWLRSRLGQERVEEHFELLPTAELLLRALHKAKFTNVLDITMGDEVLYHGPDRRYDIKDVVRQLAEQTPAHPGAQSIHLAVRLERRHSPTARVTIRRVHPQREHAIHVRFEGKLHKRLLQVFLNYLREHLQVEVTEG